RFDELSNDRLTPEVAELFVDGIAEPVEFGERRNVAAVIVADASLLQHSPWQPTPWNVHQVFARRLMSDRSNDLYDDATAGFTCLRQFGVRPTWVAAAADATTVRSLARAARSAAAPTHLDDDLDTF